MKHNILKYGILAVLWVAYTLPAMAQFDPVDPPADDDPAPVDPAPIDNWILVLVLAGIALGAYLIIKQNRKAIA